MGARKLGDSFIHLGPGKSGVRASAVSQPPFTGMEWYGGYIERHGDDGAEGRLVSQYTFTESWDSWEMHPKGSEVVICTHGAMVLIQELPDGRNEETTLTAGEYAINPSGVWHTADVVESATAIFITAGEDTQHRPR